MKQSLLFPLLAVLVSGVVFAEGEKKESGVRLEENFERAELGEGWNVQFGDWKIVDGVLQAKQVPADNHGAAARRSLAMQDGLFEMRFRLTGKGQAFHFGFDPARGELKKRGHLFSVVVTPASATILKHVDKDRPKEDPNEALAVEKTAFEPGTWYRLSVKKSGDKVEATLLPDGGSDTAIKLSAEHPTFHVKTPTLVFRCIGDGIEVDDITVTSL